MPRVRKGNRAAVATEAPEVLRRPLPELRPRSAEELAADRAKDRARAAGPAPITRAEFDAFVEVFGRVIDALVLRSSRNRWDEREPYWAMGSDDYETLREWLWKLQRKQID